MSERFTEKPVYPSNSTDEASGDASYEDKMKPIVGSAEQTNSNAVEKETRGSFTLGQEVTVQRGSEKKPPIFIEGGWTVSGFPSDKRTVMVSKLINGEMADKRVALEGLEALNSVERAEKQPLDTTQEAIADLAIENAIDVTDPASEINENAQFFKPGELRKLMKADRASRAFKPGELDAMMSGESQEEAPSEAAPDTKYDNLFNVNDNAESSVQSAAMQHEEDEDKRMTRERREADHKYNLARQTERIRDGGN